MTTNRHGQPVGPPVPGWTPRPAPDGRTLRGRDVTLERLGTQHVPDLFASLARPEHDALWTYRSDERPEDEDSLAAQCERWGARPGEVVYALAPTGGAACGLATVMRVDREMGSAEVGAVLYGPALQRTRAATEAIHLLCVHLFDELGYRRFEWKLDALNAPSAAAARRLGFTYEGRFRQAVVYKGRNRDTDWFAMTDADWPRVREAHLRWLDPDNFDEHGRQRTRLSVGG